MDYSSSRDLGQIGSWVETLDRRFRGLPRMCFCVCVCVCVCVYWRICFLYEKRLYCGIFFLLFLCFDLETDILECEVKWALESSTMNKASGGDRIPLELFQILESAAFYMPANLENPAVATGLEKVSFHSNPKERQCQRILKLLHNCTHLTC